MQRKQRPENYHGRPDWYTRAVVDAAIELSGRSGPLTGALFLRSQGISLQIARRVLGSAAG
jgi:hypothetical protein